MILIKAVKINVILMEHAVYLNGLYTKHSNIIISHLYIQHCIYFMAVDRVDQSNNIIRICDLNHKLVCSD